MVVGEGAVGFGVVWLEARCVWVIERKEEECEAWRGDGPGSFKAFVTCIAS